MTRFAYALRPVRVVFGAGSVRDAGAELARAGRHRALVLSTPGRQAEAAALRDAIGDACTGVFDRAALHVPRAIVIEGRQLLDRLAPDCLIAVGGGSPIGLGKALAAETGLRLVAIPTTYSGSEMTETWGVTEAGTKRTGRDARVAPSIVIYDPELTLSLPPDVSAASGMNAVAHAVEALYAPDASPLSTSLALDAVRRFARTLPLVVQNPADRSARAEALLAAHHAGLALGTTTMGVHHKLCHVLGGSFDLPHALTHAILLPHAVAFNREAAPDAMRALAQALGSDDAAGGLFALERSLGLPASLRELGFRDDDSPRAAELATQAPYPNPRPVTFEDVAGILRSACAGTVPQRGW